MLKWFIAVGVKHHHENIIIIIWLAQLYLLALCEIAKFIAVSSAFIQRFDKVIAEGTTDGSLINIFGWRDDRKTYL
jgi:hypothetical protein